MSSKYLLKLYVTGDTPRSRYAIANLMQLCQTHFPDQHEILVIDILKQPSIAEEARILVTPTLIKEQPEPQQRIIGDLSDTKTVLYGLGLSMVDTQPPERR